MDVVRPRGGRQKDLLMRREPRSPPWVIGRYDEAHERVWVVVGPTTAAPATVGKSPGDHGEVDEEPLGPDMRETPVPLLVILERIVGVLVQRLGVRCVPDREVQDGPRGKACA